MGIYTGRIIPAPISIGNVRFSSPRPSGFNDTLALERFTGITFPIAAAHGL
jgi:hypothetical protein